MEWRRTQKTHALKSHRNRVKTAEIQDGIKDSYAVRETRDQMEDEGQMGRFHFDSKSCDVFPMEGVCVQGTKWPSPHGRQEDLTSLLCRLSGISDVPLTLHFTTSL